MGLRFEAWTLPTSATFEKKFDIPKVLSASGVRALSEYSDETLSLPSASDLIDEIVTDTEGSWIVVKDGTKIVDEFRADRVAIPEARPSVRQISGPQRNGLVEGIAIYPKNWPNDKEDAQDWKWGYENALPPLGLGDLGHIRGQWELYTDATGGTLTITVDGDTTEALNHDSDAGTLEGSVPADTGIQGLSTVNDVAVSGEGTEDDPWVITFYDPPIPGTVSVDDSNLTGGSATLTEVEGGRLDPSPITKSKPVDAGAGSEDEHGSYGSPAVGVSTAAANKDTDADWGLRVKAESRFAGSQIVVDVTPGETYSASIRVKPDTTSTFKFVIRDVFGNHIDQAGGTLTAGSFQTLTITDMVIPGNVSQVIMRIAVVDDTPANIDWFYVNWQGATLTSGDPEATFTQIVGELLDAAHDRGTAEFLELDTTDAADSNGTALDELSFSVFFGGNAHLGHVLNDGAKSGYHWRVVDAANAKVITPTGSHVLQIFKATNGEIEDQTASAGGASITVGGKVESAETVRRIPPYTTILAHGAGALTREDTDATAESNMGRIERVFDAEPFGTDAELSAFNTSRFAEESANRKAASAVVLESDSSRPLVDYEEGSKVWWNFGSNLPKEARVVKRVSWTHGNVARYEVQGSSRLTSEAAMAKAVDFLLNQPVRRRGGGGQSVLSQLPSQEIPKRIRAVKITGKSASSMPYLNGPQAVYSPEAARTYIAFLGLDRDLYVTYYDHHEENVGPVVLADTRQLSTADDNHSAPSLDIDLDGHLHIAWGNHDAVGIRHVKSDNPHDISAWTAASLSPISTYNYIRVAPSGNIYIFYRASTGNPAGGGFNSGHGTTFPAHEFGGFIKSTDGGTSWSSEAAFIDTTGTSEAQSDVYLEGVVLNAEGTFDITWTVARGATHDDTRINFYHAVFDPADDTLHAADGTDLGSVVTWAEHPDCLAATDSEVDNGSVYRDGDRIIVGYRSVSASEGKIVIWEDDAWTVNSMATIASGVVYSVRGGLRNLAVEDMSGDGDRDLVLYGGIEDGSYWHQITTLELGVAGGFNNTGAILNRVGESVGMLGEKDSSNDPNDATASDLIPLWLVLDEAQAEYYADTTAEAGASAIDDLTDVTITSAAASDRLRYNGSAWVNTSLIWRPAMTYDGTNWLPVADGDGNAVMTEA